MDYLIEVKLEDLSTPILTSDKKFGCGVCTKSFDTKGLLRQHTEIHSEVRNYTCNICNKGFKQRSILCSHIKIHSEVRDHKCEICGKGFKQRSRLKEHVESHSDNRSHICNCGVIYKSRQGLYKHKKACLKRKIEDISEVSNKRR